MKIKRLLLTVLSLAIVAIMLASCQAASTTEAPSTLEVCFIYDGVVGDGGYYQEMDAARQRMDDKFPNVETRYIEQVGAGADAERVLSQLANEGCDFIFGTGFQHVDAVAAVAPNFPDVKFECYDSYLLGDNFGSYKIRIDQPFYLNGMLLGLMTETDKIGFVGSFPIPQVIRSINALALGAQSVNPDVTVTVVWLNTWFDPARESEAVDSLISAGADAFAHYLGGAGVNQAAETRGVYSVGGSSGMCAVAPTTCLASAGYDQEPAFSILVQSVLDDSWKAEEVWFTMTEDAAILTEINNVVPEDARQLVEAKKAEFVAGTSDIFLGPIVDQNGVVQVAEGETLPVEVLSTMDWLIEGVIGTLPE